MRRPMLPVGRPAPQPRRPGRYAQRPVLRRVTGPRSMRAPALRGPLGVMYSRRRCAAEQRPAMVAQAPQMSTESSPTSVHLPGVDRLVAMHQRHIAGEHAAECLLPCFAGLLPPRHLCDLPGRSIGQTQAATFDDVQEAADLGLVHFPLPQAIRRKWQQLADHQLRHPHLSDLWPVDLRSNAVTNTRDEVLFGRLEGHLGPDRTILAGQGTHYSGEERGVCNRVHDGGSCWEHPVLHPQMRTVTADVIDRPIPAIDGAVVQPELVKARHAAAVEYRNGVLVGADRQQCRKVARVLLEEVEDRGDPALAEPHSGTYALSLQLFTPCVGALLKERDARLSHQLLAKKEG